MENINNNTNTNTRQSLMGFSGWGNLVPKEEPQDTLKLEYPALASQIDEAISQGWDRNKLRQYLAERESIALTQYSQQEINSFLGRNDENIEQFWKAMKKQNDDAYVKIMKYDMNEAKVRDILKTSQLSGIAPGVLFMNPEILQQAEELAGKREDFLGQSVAAVRNALANYNQSTAGAEYLDAQTIKNAMSDDKTMLDEGLRIWNAGLKTTLNPPNDEELINMARQSYQKRLDSVEQAAKKDEQDAQDWAVHVRPPDSVIGAALVSAVENSGFTIASAVRTWTGWTLGGPVGGLMMSLYNTYDESQHEAGEAFMEALRRGMSPEDAYNRAKLVRAENLLFLPFSNYGADYVFYRGADLIGKFTDPLIPGTSLFRKAARFTVRNAVPFLIDNATEGVEEYAQEFFKMNALGDEIDESKLWDAFKIGMADAVIYSIVGSSLNRALQGAKFAGNKIYSLTPAGKKAQQRKQLQQVFQGAVQQIRDVQELGEKISRGEINPNDIVGEDPVVFIPQSRLDENTAAALGVQNEILEDEQGNEVQTEQSEQSTQQEQNEEPEDNEIAIRKSTWDKFAAENPEKANELQDVIREGTQGVTAQEDLKRKTIALDRAINGNDKIREGALRFQQELIDAGRDTQEAKSLAAVSALMGNSMVEQFGIDPEQAMNFAVKPENERQSTAPTSRGVTDLNSLLARNSEAETEFHNLMAQLQNDFGGELLERQTMKRAERIIEKVNNDYGGDFSRVVDVWGGSLIFDNEQDLLNALEKLQQRGDVVRLKNKWANPDDTGYRDINANIRLSNGVVVELQLHNRGVMNVKNEIGHSLYEFIRKNKGNNELEAAIEKAKNISRQFYDAGIDGTYDKADANSKASALEIARALSSQTSAREADTLLNELSELTRKTFVPSSSEIPSTAQRDDALGSSSENSTANGTSSPFSKNLNTSITSTTSLNENSGGVNGQLESYNQSANNTENTPTAFIAHSMLEMVNNDKFRSNFYRLYELKENAMEHGFTAEQVDDVLKMLRDKEIIQLNAADTSLIAPEHIPNLFIDENNFLMGSFGIWNIDALRSMTESYIDNTPAPSANDRAKAAEAGAFVVQSMLDLINEDPGRIFQHIFKVREKAMAQGFTPEQIDNVLKMLRDEGIVQLHTGDASLTTPEHVANFFVDENGFRLGSFTVQDMDALKTYGDVFSYFAKGNDSEETAQAEEISPTSESEHANISPAVEETSQAGENAQNITPESNAESSNSYPVKTATFFMLYDFLRILLNISLPIASSGWNLPANTI